MYKERLKDIERIILPSEMNYSTHVYHQFTLIVKEKRDELKQFLADNGIPAQIYYPLPISEQEAYRDIVRKPVPLDNSYYLADHVLSLPMHTELTEAQIEYIASSIKDYFKNN